MNIEQQHNGSFLCTYIDDNDNYHKQIYYGYSKREAKVRFKEYLLEQEVHEYIDADDDSGFVTCNGKGEII